MNRLINICLLCVVIVGFSAEPLPANEMDVKDNTTLSIDPSASYVLRIGKKQPFKKDICICLFTNEDSSAQNVGKVIDEKYTDARGKYTLYQCQVYIQRQFSPRGDLVCKNKINNQLIAIHFDVQNNDDYLNVINNPGYAIYGRVPYTTTSTSKEPTERMQETSEQLQKYKQISPIDEQTFLTDEEHIPLPDEHTSKEKGSSSGAMVAVYILSIALLAVTAILLWVLLRKRFQARGMQMFNLRKQHKEKLLEASGQSQCSLEKNGEDITSKDSVTILDIPSEVNNKLTTVTVDQKPADKQKINGAQKQVTREQKDEQKSAMQEQIIKYEHKAIINEQKLNDNVPANGEYKSSEHKPTMGERNIMMEEQNGDLKSRKKTSSQENLNSPLKEVTSSEVNGPQSPRSQKTNHQINMMKDCFGEAVTKMKKKPLIPTKPKKALRPEISNDIEENVNKDLDKDLYIKEAEKAKPGTKEEKMIENDMYVSANIMEEYDKLASEMRHVKETFEAPIIRPPTVFLNSEQTDDLEEYDTPKSVLTAIKSAKKHEAPKKIEEGGDNLSDDEMYMSPSPVIRKFNPDDTSTTPTEHTTDEGTTKSEESDDMYSSPSHVLKKYVFDHL